MCQALRFVSPEAFWRPQHPVTSTWLEHAPFAFWLTKTLRPGTVVWFGAPADGSYLIICQAVRQIGLAARCFAIHPWTGDEPDAFARLNQTNEAHYKAFSTLVRDTSDHAAQGFGDGTIDLLHIDFRTDVSAWWPKLSERAVVLFHDIHAHETGFGALRAWQHLSAGHPSFHFTHGGGLGVLCPGQAIPDALRDLFDADEATRASVRQIYAQLGAAISLVNERDHLRAIVADRDGAIETLRRSAQQAQEAFVSEKEQLQDRLRATGRALAHARSEIRHICLSQASAVERLQVIETSTFWRASRPLLAAIGRLPPWVRPGLRKSLRLARGLARRLVRVGRKAVRLVRRHAGIQPSGLRFVPPPPDAPIDAAGRYELTEPSGRYVYVPPNRPDDMESQIAGLKRAPLFSIVMPTYDTPDSLMQRVIGSVAAQWYDKWELIIVDDASPRDATRNALRCIRDPRIRTVFLPENKGIAGATNEALRHARGDYVVFLDHDDELTVDCLYELALCIGKTDADFVYSDEDKIEPNGDFSQPFFKPEWSPDSMMSTMYTCHVMCVRKATLDRVGGLNSDFDGCQDYDLVLRITEQTDRVAHVPKVLYHWRILPGSIAADVAAKPAAVDASRRVRVAALARRGLPATVEPVPQRPEYFRVNYHLLGLPRISIIVPTKNNARLLRRCLDSIRSRSSYADYEIVVIDNGSTQPETQAYLREQASERQTLVVSYDKPFNYSAINNLGAQRASGSILVFLNDDTEVLSNDWLERMGGYAQLPHVGAVGAKLLYPNTRKIQHNGILNLASGPGHAFLSEDADAPGYFMRNLLEHNWIAVTGACLMVERAKFDTVGGFDENLPIAYNDVKFCFDLLDHGLYNVVCASVELYHHEAASRGIDHLNAVKHERLKRERAYLYRTSPQYFMRDPFHNPNLLPDSLAFELAA